VIVQESAVPRRLPIEPPASEWVLPDPLTGAIADDIVGVGADLSPGTMLAGYRAGMFGMRTELDGQDVLAWWSPQERGVLPLDGLKVSRSLAKSARRFQIRINSAFTEVVHACRHGVRPGDRDGEWIVEEYVQAYEQLHALGWAHSVEAWRGHRLAGGLLCVEIGGLVCGESMFSRERDASKVALMGLVSMLDRAGKDPALPGGRFIDVQWVTEHLASLGAVGVDRHRYLSELLPRALRLEPVLAGQALDSRARELGVVTSPEPGQDDPALSQEDL
jgi:leucyl/phenylalanyl-tRNA---protein transferase